MTKGPPGITRLRGGAAWAPLLPRLVLGVTFIWAGIGKFCDQIPFPGSFRGLLEEMGAVDPQPVPNPASNPDRPDLGNDSKPQTESPAPAEPPVSTSSKAAPNVAHQEDTTDQSAGEKEHKAMADSPDSAQAAETVTQQPEVPDVGPVRKVWGLGIMLYRSAHPEPESSSSADDAQAKTQPPMATWPKFLGTPRRAGLQAWAVMIAEMVGGVLVLTGFLTRLGGMMLAAVMLGAIWLAQIGPAIATGQTVLWILPNYSTWDPSEWSMLFWPLSLLALAGAVTLLGAGRLGLDGYFFGSRWKDDTDEL